MSPDAIARWAEHAEAAPAAPTVSPDGQPRKRAALAETAPAAPTLAALSAASHPPASSTLTYAVGISS
jgi:hypothetical protein